MGVTERLLQLSDLLLCFVDLTFHRVNFLNVVTGDFGLFLPLDSLLLVLSHLVAIEVELLLYLL